MMAAACAPVCNKKKKNPTCSRQHTNHRMAVVVNLSVFSPSNRYDNSFLVKKEEGLLRVKTLPSVVFCLNPVIRWVTVRTDATLLNPPAECLEKKITKEVCSRFPGVWVLPPRATDLLPLPGRRAWCLKWDGQRGEKKLWPRPVLHF